MKVGIIGWRGMVGSVLMGRMAAEADFDHIEASFFSTSNAGGQGPDVPGQDRTLLDGNDIRELAKQEAIITCQGGAYTGDVYPQLRAAGWDGYWIDAASKLRMDDQTVLVLDPVNLEVIKTGLLSGHKVFCGPNCTVSLMLMALDGLFRADLVEWITAMTYQAASGAGAANMRELVQQMGQMADAVRPDLADPAATALAIDAKVTAAQRADSLSTDHFGVPLAGSLIPWIDVPAEGGQSREELKAYLEGNKILGKSPPIPMDGICVRVGSMRCHAQGFTVKLRRDVPMQDVNAILASANDWVRVVPNEPDVTKAQLAPAAVSGSLEVPVGRLRKMHMGGEYLGAFSVGDQLLWGAAEPLRRMLRILLDHRS